MEKVSLETKQSINRGNMSIEKVIRQSWKPRSKAKSIAIIKLFTHNKNSAYRMNVYGLGKDDHVCIPESYFIVYDDENNVIVRSSPSLN